MFALFSSSCSPSVGIVYILLNFLHDYAIKERPEFDDEENDKF